MGQLAETGELGDAQRAPHIMLKSVVNNSAIDDIWDKRQTMLEPLQAEMNAALGWDPPPFTGEGNHTKHGGRGAGAMALIHWSRRS